MIVRLLAILILPILAAISLPSGTAQAATFDPGRIIDDVIFTNASSMSVAQIQSFLNSKVPTCDTNGAQQSEMNNAGVPDYNSNGSIQRWEWGKYHYNQTTFPCLRDYSQDGVSSAQLIYNAAQTYAINPQVLIVLLQKEQALVTDTWPLDIQYRSATGYGCPDTAACDSQYYGLINQLNWASTMFRSILNNSPTWYTPYILGNNYIRYNPVVACGGTIVNIQNRSTQALYNYTPYQPNASALNAGYGMGDACGAYGNRNFWLYFNDWFGSTLADSYYAVYSAESAHPSLVFNESKTVFIRYRNQGNATWYDTASTKRGSSPPVVLATLGPVNRCSIFTSLSWASCNRPALNFSKVYLSDGVTLAPDQHAADPTNIVEYSFVITAPGDVYEGVYNEYFAPIREGASGWGWYMGADNVFLDISVSTSYTAAYAGQSSYPVISQNSRSDAYIRFRNTGLSTWHDSTSATQAGVKPVVLAADGPINRQSPFSSTWPNGARAGTVFSKVYEDDGSTLSANQHVASPGQIVEYDFKLTAQFAQKLGKYREYFHLIREGGVNWPIRGSAAFLDVTVIKSDYQASYYTESPSVTFTSGDGSTSILSFSFKNTGGTPWYDDGAWTPGILPTHLATTWPINRVSSLYNPSWLNNSRPSNTFSKVLEGDGNTVAQNQHIALPGQIAEYTFTLNTSSAPGTYREYFQPIIEGSPTWSMGGVVWQQVTVN